jgi:hypothetical protein
LKAVNTSTEHLLLNALDHRAAAYEKLEQLQPALRDSKRMIDLKPDLSKVCTEHAVNSWQILTNLRAIFAVARSYSLKARMLWLSKSMRGVLGRSRLEPMNNERLVASLDLYNYLTPLALTNHVQQITTDPESWENT